MKDIAANILAERIASLIPFQVIVEPGAALETA